MDTVIIDTTKKSSKLKALFEGRGKKRTIISIILVLLVILMLWAIQVKTRGIIYKDDLVYNGIRPLPDANSYKVITDEMSAQILTKMRAEYTPTKVYTLDQWDSIPKYLINPVKELNPTLGDNKEKLLPLVNKYLKEREIISLYNYQLNASLSPEIPVAQ